MSATSGDATARRVPSTASSVVTAIVSVGAASM
jgi:hypothetical protein